jgi:N-acetylmuramoyl-L-alanine amidase
MVSRSFVLCGAVLVAAAGCSSVQEGSTAPRSTTMTTAAVARRLGLMPTYDIANGILVFSGDRGSVAFNPEMRGVLIGDDVCFRELNLAVLPDRVEVPVGFFDVCEKKLGVAPKRPPADPEAAKPTPKRPARVYHVVIDPGHGGRDPGAIGRSGMFEKTVNLDVASKVTARLRAAGVAVTMTRSNDRFIGLNDRPAVGNHHHADLFVSIHADWNADPGMRGFTLFVCHDKYSDASRAALVAREARATAASVQKVLAVNRERSRQLAAALRARLKQATGAPDRGTRLGAYRVLRRSICPAALIEMGFLSNAAEERRLGQADYRNTLAAAITNGILDYLRRN